MKSALMKRVLPAALVLFGLLVPAWAKGPQGIENTWHNMSSTNSDNAWYSADNEDEICIFCHTPHGGTLNRPLWNRSMPNQSGANAFTHYSSATISTVLSGLSQTRAVSDESLACMSCHDGILAINRVLNPSNRTGGQPTINLGDEPLVYLFGPPGSRIGDAPDGFGGSLGEIRNLTDDHPISFSYHDVITNDTAAAAKLQTIANAEADGVRFFPPNAAAAAGTKRVECSTCHDPHVDYDPFSRGLGDTAYTPFLITSNAGSALCLACHIK